MAGIIINKLLAKAISYGGTRHLSSITKKVIHYTGNKGDTAKNNAVYYATSNTREAGAHYYISTDGEIWESIPIKYTAWAVGGGRQSSSGGSYYGRCTNANSVSIELCDCINGASWEQLLALRKLCKYIDKQCPNAKTIIRHWDVNGKSCPAPMTGNNNKKWKHLLNFITKDYQFRAEVTKKAAIRSSKGVKPNNKIGEKKKGTIVCITKVVGNWGRLKKKTPDGKFRWITMSKLKEL